MIVLRCFLSGVTPCDSIGAIDPASIDAAAMELARTNLLHRCLLEGSLVERENSIDPTCMCARSAPVGMQSSA